MERVNVKWREIIAGLGKPARVGIKRFLIPVRQGLRIFAILPEGPDRTILEALCRDVGWTLSFAARFDESMAGTASEIPAIILYDRRTPGCDWRQGIRTLSKLPLHPCVILVSPTSDRNLWDELQFFGGSDILRSPIEPERALRAVIRASLLWQNEQEVRSPRQQRQF